MPAKLHIYRVEHRETRKGPYSTRTGLSFRLAGMSSYSRHPEIDDEPMLFGRTGYSTSDLFGADVRFGFLGMCDLEAWFDEDMRHDLKAADFVIRTYEVQDEEDLLFVGARSGQVVAWASDLKEVATKEMIDGD